MKTLLFMSYTLALLCLTVLGISSKASAEMININWVDAGTPYKDTTANAGDTVKFIWGGLHNVYIHPTGNCDKTNAVFVGNKTGTTYTFTNDDAHVTFVCDVGSHCDYGQIITFHLGEDGGEHSSGFFSSIGIVALIVGLMSSMMFMLS